MSIAQKIVSRPVLGIIVFGLVAVIALFMVSDIAIDMLPEINMPMLTVSTSYFGAGPETVEEAVTRALESQLVNVSGLTSITSTSSEGFSAITLQFDFGLNLDAKTNDVRDRLDRVRGSLPSGAGAPSISRFDLNSMPILRIAVAGNRNQDELRALAKSLVQTSLEQIDGVASTTLMGGRERIVSVEVSQNRMEAYGLTLTGIRNTLASQNLELGAGSIEDGSINYSIRTAGTYTSIQDIANTVVTKRNGIDIRLQDVGTVGLGYPKESSTVYINGESGVYVGVVKQSGSNSVNVADRVKARLDVIRQTLPSDVSLIITVDQTNQTKGMINELVSSALSGALLAMLILFLFLRNIKSTVIIGISIPFSVLTTLLFMSAAGVTLNMVTMTGLILGVGMIVDCSIVVLENIFKYRERGSKPAIAAVLGSQEVMSSIVSSTLTTICVFGPVYLFKSRIGAIGEMIQGLSFTVVVALVSSLLVALFLVPILAGKFLPLNTRAQKPLKNPLLKKLDARADKALIGIEKGYRRLLAIAVSHRLAVIVLVIALLAGSVLAIPHMPIVMMAGVNEESVTLNVTLPQGTIYENTRAVMLQLQEFAIAEIKGAKNIIVDAGSSGQSSGGTNTNTGSITVTLDLDNPAADKSDVVKTKLLAHGPDIPNAVLTIAESGSSQALGGGSDIDITLHVDDIAAGISAANEIADIIRTNVPELAEVSVDMTKGLPQVEVVLDRERIYNMGLSISSIANEISAAMNGVTATTFRNGGDEYNVVLHFAETDRDKLSDLEHIFAASSDGTMYSLANFASLEKGAGPVSIRRENQSRIIHVTGSLASDSLRADAVENKIKEVLDINFITPNGVILSYEGQWGEIISMVMNFGIILFISVLLVFGVMAAQYESFKDPFINLCTIPLLVIGVVMIYLITGQPISLFTMVGIVILAGVVVNNGIVLVDYTKILVGRGIPVRQAVLEAGFSRLRPVLMATLTTILGLIPMSFFPGESAAMMQGIGLTVIGGLTSSTIITLFFIPVMYSLVNEKRGKKVKTVDINSAKENV
jgi:HAE1 family hydrophobic/amphiphilic exporter-1